MPDFFQHPQALVESSQIGDGTRVWAFAHVLPGAKVGRDCNICDHVFIENQVIVGDRVTIKCGVQLWDGVTVEDDVFIGPNVTFTNDRFPRSRLRPKEWAKTIVHRNASIGANATILPNVEIGERAMVGAGAVVTRSVPPNSIVVGNPARITGYVDASKVAWIPPHQPAADEEFIQPFLHVTQVKAFKIPIITDLRGSISPMEIGKNLPFVPNRIFTVFNVPGTEVRGEHSHRLCHQFFVCVAGRVTVLVDDGKAREQIILNTPATGIWVPPNIWSVQYQYSRDAVLLVAASHAYDADDYIRDYDLFLKAREAKPGD